MNDIRTLPPLLIGKVSGFLKLCVEEVNISKNILRLTDNCNILVQVQWWGEILPTVLRPKKLRLLKRTEGHENKEMYCHCADYEIRTSLNLFKAYLKNCEALELIILEADKNIPLASAFFKNLNDITDKSNSNIQLSLFDYQGDSIGEIKILVNFFTKSFESEGHNDFEKVNPAITVDSSDEKLKETFEDKLEIQVNCNKNIQKDMKDNFFKNKKSSKFCFKKQSSSDNSSEVNLNSVKTSDLIDKFQAIKPFQKTLSLQDNSKTMSKLCNIDDSNYVNKKTDNLAVPNQEMLDLVFPQIQRLSDFSKVISFNKAQNKKPEITKKHIKSKSSVTISQNSKCKPLKQKNKTLMPPANKRALSKQCSHDKAKISGNKFQNSKEKKIVIDKNKCISQFNSSELVKQNQPYVVPCSGFIAEYNNNHEISLKKPLNENVVNYLLGCDMTKEDEENALSDLKNMSPCQNFVKSFSQVYENCNLLSQEKYKVSCLAIDSNIPKCTINTSNKKIHHLNFNFNNPVEREYYERFFVDVKCTHAFEIAQILNQPQISSAHSEKNLLGGKICQDAIKKKPCSIVCTTSTCSNGKSEKGSISSWDNEEACQISNCANEENHTVDKNVCCEYFKKLNNLDKILESLNNFQRKILTSEKESVKKS